jgi:hypothetical protein
VGSYDPEILGFSSQLDAHCLHIKQDAHRLLYPTEGCISIQQAKTKLTPRRPRQRTSSDGENKSNGANVAVGEAAVAAIPLSPLVEGRDNHDDDLDLRAAPSKEEKINATSCLPEERRRKVEKQFEKLQQHVPMANRIMGMINMCPPRVRMAILSLWVLWKVILVLVMLHVALFTTSTLADSYSEDSASATRFTREVGGYDDNGGDTEPARILYIVTTLAEYNNGLRKTEKGQDRLGEILIPILVDSVESMVHEPFNYHVDVFLISAFELRPEREQHIRERLPNGVGFEVWDDACPMVYEAKHSENKVIDNTRALARQHRYVIKDKLPYYDLFLAFEGKPGLVVCLVSKLQPYLNTLSLTVTLNPR